METFFNYFDTILFTMRRRQRETKKRVPLRKKALTAAAIAAIGVGSSGCAALPKAVGFLTSQIASKTVGIFVKGSTGKAVAGAVGGALGKEAAKGTVSERGSSKKAPAPKGLPGVSPKWKAQWNEILRLYPYRNPSNKRNMAVIDLISRVQKRLNASPAEVLLVAEKCTLSEKYFWEMRRREKLSKQEERVFRELLRERKSDWDAFFWLTKWAGLSVHERKKLEAIAKTSLVAKQ